jgi:hypothetical protein
MANYAVVRDGTVENIIVWDGLAEYSGAGTELVETTAEARMGGSWDGNVFTFVEPPVPEPTAEEVAHAEKVASAKEKLGALGLDADEVSALFGI